jgi:hypothetical protein
VDWTANRFVRRCQGANASEVVPLGEVFDRFSDVRSGRSLLLSIQACQGHSFTWSTNLRTYRMRWSIVLNFRLRESYWLRPSIQHSLKACCSDAAAVRSPDGEPDLIHRLPSRLTGVNETQIRGRLAAERNEGTPQLNRDYGEGATKAKKTHTGISTGAKRTKSRGPQQARS